MNKVIEITANGAWVQFMELDKKVLLEFERHEDLRGLNYEDLTREINEFTSEEISFYKHH